MSMRTEQKGGGRREIGSWRAEFISAFSILRRDLLVEYRRKGVLNTVIVFSLVVLFVFYFSLERTPRNLALIGPPALWASLLFGAFLGLNHFVQIEKDNGCMGALIASPVAPMSIFLAKVGSVFLLLFLVEAVLVPAFLVLFGFQWTASLLWLIPVLFLANAGIAAPGVLFSCVLVLGRAPGYLLPVLLLPFLLPLIIILGQVTLPLLTPATGVEEVSRTLNNGENWIIFLFALDLVYLPTTALLSEAILEPS